MPRGGVGEVMRYRAGSIAIARKGAPLPPLIFIGSAIDERAADRKLIEVGEVLERRDVALVEHAVRFVSVDCP